MKGRHRRAPRTNKVEVSRGEMTVASDWFPGLLDAKQFQHENCVVLSHCVGIRWTELDAHSSVEGLLPGSDRAEAQ
jgi:hypothetical protein